MFVRGQREKNRERERERERVSKRNGAWKISFVLLLRRNRVEGNNRYIFLNGAFEFLEIKKVRATFVRCKIRAAIPVGK